MTIIAKRQTEIFKSDDPYFNAEAAQKSFDLVMKMDEEEARVFTSAVVFEQIHDTIEKNQRTLQAHLDRVVEKRISKMAKGVSNTYVAKRMNEEEFDLDEALAAAGAVALISKAVRNPYDYGYQFDENRVRRNASGQFTVKIKPNKGMKPMHQKNAERQGIPHIDRLSSEQRAQYQQEYAQVAAALASFGAETPTTVVVQNRATKQIHELDPGNNTRPDAKLWNPRVEDVVAVHARPKNLQVGGASFDLVSSLGASPALAGQTGATMATLDGQGPGGLSSFSRDWSNESGVDPLSNNGRMYHRLKTGSDFLGAVAPTGSKLQLAMSFGRFVGEHGPEAEKVIGPKARKTAYRYRGEEKAPEPEVEAAYRDAVHSVDSPEHRTKVRNASNRALTEAKKKYADKTKTPIDAVKLPMEMQREIVQEARRKVGEDKSPSSPGRHAARLEIAGKLMREGKANRPDLYELHLASGHLPPSEGIMINRKGEVVSQAVGYADDHYLPFNLKKLGALKGGEYIRTRSIGGPTSEDLYTGLLAGAKHITVTSRSGTFLVEFEDGFGGKRRFGDKSRRMVDRYEKLLDAVQSGQVKRGKDIKPEIRAKIHARVMEDLPFNVSRTEREGKIREAEEEYRRHPDMTEEDEQFIQEQAALDHNANPAKPLAASESEYRNMLKESKELNFQLNGRGYEDALKALKEQFPYFIANVRRIPVGGDPARGASTIDRGYVQPKHNRPKAAQDGYFDENINGRGKVSAASVDYQNYGVRRGRLEAVRKPDEDTGGERPREVTSSGGGTSPAAGGATARAPKSAAEFGRQIEADIDLNKVKVKAFGILKSKVKLPESLENMSVEDFETMINERPKSQAGLDFESLMSNDAIWNGGTDAAGNKTGAILGEDIKNQYDRARGAVAGLSYSPSRAFTTGEIQHFEGDAYDRDKVTQQMYSNETGVRNQKGLSGKFTSEMSDDELVGELEKMKELKLRVDALRRSGAPLNRLAIKQWYPDTDHPIINAALQDSPEPLLQKAENVHRMRALKANQGNVEFNELRFTEMAPSGAESRAHNNQNSGKVNRASANLRSAALAADEAGDDKAARELGELMGMMGDFEGKTISNADIKQAGDRLEELKRRYPKHFGMASS